MKQNNYQYEEPLEQIWREYHNKLYNFVKNRVSDASIVDDILQEIFIRIFTRIDTLRNSDKIQSWIYQITRNVIIDYYRTQKKTEELPPAVAYPEADNNGKSRQEIANCLKPMIENLPEHYRQAVKLSEIKGLPQKQVASQQGLSLSGAKARIQRGRAMIKKQLLECCRFEFDHKGKVIDFEGNEKGCNGNGKSCDKC